MPELNGYSHKKLYETMLLAEELDIHLALILGSLTLYKNKPPGAEPEPNHIITVNDYSSTELLAYLTGVKHGRDTVPKIC